MSATFAPSMPAGSHEMRNYYSNQDPPRSTPHTAPSITPYLGLRARLSQIWINRWTILLLLVLARTLIAIGSINDDLASARREALSACSDVESMGSAMASMPHYMSQGVNELTAKGVEKSVNGLISMSELSVTAVEEIVVFVIGMMTNTYLCLITFAVTGSLRSVIGVIDASQDDINKLSSKVGGELGDTLTKFTDAYKKVADSLDSVNIFGSSNPLDLPDAPDVTAQVNELKNFKLPESLDADLQKLNSSLPTFEQVKNVTEGVIRLPFEKLKEVMREEMGNYTFDRSVFPVPAKEQLTFCSDNDGINDFFDELAALAAKAKIIFIAVLVVAAVLVTAPMAWRELKRWRHQQERSQLVLNASTDPMDTVYLVSRPYTSTLGVKLARSDIRQPSVATPRQQAIRWAVAYATSDAALFVLTLAVAGLFACLCQVILLRSLQSQTPQLTQQVGQFADKVVAQLNNASEQWAIGTNGAIEATNRDINQNMLGWVDIATEAINNTLNTFVNETSNVLDEAFGDGPLRDPIQEVLNCLVLLKVQGIQKALTWVRDNAKVDFPLLPNDTFTLGAVASLSSNTADDSFLATPGDKASDKITAAVARFINSLEEGIRTEAIISTFVLLIWVIIVLIGVVRAVIVCCTHRATRAEGGAPPQEYPAMVQPNQDFRSDNQDRFVDIPLRPANGPRTPAPEYSERMEAKNEARRNPFVSDEDHEASYDNEKLPFRNRDTKSNMI
jgi:hypothetical protein